VPFDLPERRDHLASRFIVAMTGGLAVGTLVVFAFMLALRWLGLEPNSIAYREPQVVQPTIQPPAEEPEIGPLDLASRIR
jgi:hypothetical protein